MIVSNLAIAFGTLAETVELFLAIFMMIGGIYLTFLVQKWADRTGEAQASAANIGKGGTITHEERGMRG
jgi:threonine/homoserine/homoserine lactone efflux protein